MTTDKTVKKAIQPFDHIIRQINNGQLVDELTDEMTAVIEAVKMTGKTGKISLTLTLCPGGPNNSQLEVKPSITGTKPELPRPFSYFFINDDYGLQREDPRQHHIEGISPVSEVKPSGVKKL